MKFNDRVSVGDVRKTGEGYLVATARVARTGVQLYLASELGDVALTAGFRPADIVRVNRPAGSVFSDSVLRSITRVPVTVDHPPEEVTAENWSKYAVGEVGDRVKEDGEWIVVNPMVKDAAAIAAAQTTHKEISMGYRAELVEAADKSIADFDMTEIKMNHLALVPVGRAGPQARIGDGWGIESINDRKPGAKPPTKTEKVEMTDTLQTVVLGDKAVQVAATDVAAIEAFKASTTKAMSDAEAAHKTTIAAKDAELAKKDAEIDALKAKVLDDAAIDAKVQERADLIATAKAIADQDYTGKSADEIRKAAVVAKVGDAAIKDKSPEYIAARFDILAEDAKADPVRKHLASPAPRQVQDNGYSDYVKRLKDPNYKPSDGGAH